MGESTGFDYSRTANPTRTALEKALAVLDGGSRACAFSSGMAALDAAFRLMGESVSKRIVESIMTNPATMSHASMPAEERARRGIGDNLVRFSVGLEAKEDLLADICQALDRASRRAD